jgi:hypothetical protein
MIVHSNFAIPAPMIYKGTNIFWHPPWAQKVNGHLNEKMYSAFKHINWFLVALNGFGYEFDIDYTSFSK